MMDVFYAQNPSIGPPFASKTTGEARRRTVEGFHPHPIKVLNRSVVGGETLADRQPF